MVDIISISDGDTNWGTKMRTNLTNLSAAIDALNGAYKKPVSGIPIADLAASVQASLAKADTAVQAAQLTKAAVGLSNVDNTSDANKPVSSAQSDAINTAFGNAHGDAKRKYQREWTAKRRADWLESQGGACVRCGSTDRLEVDHIDRSTKVCSPKAIWNRNKAFRDVELAKCQVLCNTCHTEKTIAELEVEYPHGTYARYTSRKGCRCERCTATVAPYWREYRANKAA